MIGEAYATINYTMKFYSQESNRTHMPINLIFITELDHFSSAIDIKNTINLWLDNMPKDK